MIGMNLISHEKSVTCSRFRTCRMEEIARARMICLGKICTHLSKCSSSSSSPLNFSLYSGQLSAMIKVKDRLVQNGTKTPNQGMNEGFSSLIPRRIVKIKKKITHPTVQKKDPLGPRFRNLRNGHRRKKHNKKRPSQRGINTCVLKEIEN